MDSDTKKGEEWRDVPEWEGLYEVSSLGRIRSVSRYVEGSQRHLRGRVLKQRAPHGYVLVTLSYLPYKQSTRQSVSALVLQAFVGPRPPGYEACHGPNGSLDNSVANLRWDTKRNNQLDRRKWGRPLWTGTKPKQFLGQCAICKKDVIRVHFKASKERMCSIACRSEWTRRRARAPSTGTFLAATSTWNP